jgi:hypothetical protein
MRSDFHERFVLGFSTASNLPLLFISIPSLFRIGSPIVSIRWARIFQVQFPFNYPSLNRLT